MNIIKEDAQDIQLMEQNLEASPFSQRWQSQGLSTSCTMYICIIICSYRHFTWTQFLCIWQDLPYFQLNDVLTFKPF